MPQEVRIPRLGWSMEQGTFLGWLKKDGDEVKEGDSLYELEGEKAAQEIESIDEGILRIPSDAPSAGTELPVGALLAFICDPGEEAPSSVGEQETLDSTSESESPSNEAKVAGEAGPASPAVRRRALELGVQLEDVSGTGRGGRITREDVDRQAQTAVSTSLVPTKSSSVATSKQVIASPRARRVARELNVDWTRLAGTGRNGRIRERDVRAAIGDVRGLADDVVTQPVSPRRRVIAQRMLASHQQTAPVTLTTKVDASSLVSIRRQFKRTDESNVVPTFTDIMAKLVAAVLKDHPSLAAQWTDEGLVLPSDDTTYIGMAVDTDAGLLVPVVGDVNRLALVELAKQAQEMVQLARSGKLKPAQMQGAVFTITNLGGYGIDAFTPIINCPETAILGLGAIRREPVVVDEDQLEVRDTMTLSLTFDHRVVDGAPAARFLAAVRNAVENPVPFLLGTA